MEKRDDMYKVYMHMLLISLLRRLEEVLKGIVVDTRIFIGDMAMTVVNNR